METLNKPELNVLNLGKSLKTLQISAFAGMTMPQHHTTKEAVLVIQQGKALLKMDGTDYILEKGMTFTIPAMVEHSLEIKENFEAFAIMASDSQIEFNKQ